MLSQCDSLVRATECRYATDAELIFLLHYRKSYPSRLGLYKKIEQLEQSIVAAIYQRIQADFPQLLRSQQRDISGKWKQDISRTIRYCATAILLDDPDSIREKYLLWFQTVMNSFKARRSCDITYTIMQEVVKELFTTEELDMLIPIVQLVRANLGTSETTPLTKL